MSDSELLELLQQSFLQLGSAATTAQLAERACVSEATLFKRFGSKEAMLTRALQLPPLDDEPWFQNMLEQAGEVPLGAALDTIARGIASYAGKLFPRIVCGYGRPLSPAEVRSVFGVNEAPTLRIVTRLTQVFEVEIERGRVRAVPPEHLAKMTVGGVLHEVHLRTFYPESSADPDGYARQLAATLVALVAT